MKNPIPKLLFTGLVLLAFVAPSVVFAQTDPPPKTLIPCGTESADGKVVDHPCGFRDVMTLINKVIHFILYYMVLPIAAVMFAYAGILLLTAGGESSSAKTKAKNIFLNTVIGLIIAVASFLIVKTILTVLGYNGPMYF